MSVYMKTSLWFTERNAVRLWHDEALAAEQRPLTAAPDHQNIWKHLGPAR